MTPHTPRCPTDGLALKPLPPPGVWPDYMICPKGHRWKLPLPLTLELDNPWWNR